MNETLIYTDSRPRAKSTGHAFGFEGNLGMPVIISGMVSVFILTLLLNGDNRMPLFAKFLIALLPTVLRRRLEKDCDIARVHGRNRAKLARLV